MMPCPCIRAGALLYHDIREDNDSMIKVILVYLLLMNIAGFAAMGIDKYKAQHHKWRLPEKTLFGISLIGGSVGTWAGMYAFRHKTKHWYFVKGMPAILFIHLVIASVIYRNFF